MTDIVASIARLDPGVVKSDVAKITKALSSLSRSRDTLDKLRRLYQLYSVRNADVPEDLTHSLLRLVENEHTPFKVRCISAYMLIHTLRGDITILTENLSAFRAGYREGVMLLFTTLGGMPALKANIANIPQWLCAEDYAYKGALFSGFLTLLRQEPQLLDVAKVQPLERKIDTWLLHASTQSAKPQSSGTFFSVQGSKQQPVTELDGSMIALGDGEADIFTVLNESLSYTTDQVFNIHTFSMLYTHLDALYVKNISTKEGEESSAKPQQKFVEVIIKYCLRVIEQAKWTPHEESPQNIVNHTVADIAQVEAIRILDRLCKLDASLVPRLFPNINKVFQNVTGNVTPANAQVLLALLRFWVNHGKAVVYDAEPIIRAFFEEYLSTYYADAFIAFETVFFCIENKDVLIHTTNLFSTYFPPLLKLFAWAPTQYHKEFYELVPCFVGPSTYLELFHSLLDLPLLASALERIVYTTENVGGTSNDRNESVGSYASYGRYDAEMLRANQYHVVYNLLLRNESGLAINFWDNSSTASIVAAFCEETIMSPRVLAACERAVDLVDIYFDVMISYAEEQQLFDMVPIIFSRITHLFPQDEYRKKVRAIMADKVLAIFEKYPHFVVSHKNLIIETIGDTSEPARAELILNLCWIIGAYVSRNIVPEVNTSLMNVYEEALELFAFERMSIVSVTSSELNGSTDNEVDEYNTRLMLLVMGALSKLAARYQPLTSRVILCLAKLLRYDKYFHNTVIERANECLTLLKYPSIAASILDVQHKTEPTSHHVDENSSLPFLLRSASEYIPQKKIHQFMF